MVSPPSEGQQLLGSTWIGLNLLPYAAHRTLHRRALGLGVIARVLGVIRAADATSSIVDALVTVLQARASTLLILDNLEQLPHSAHQVLATLLGACPALHLLCTSRVRLQVWGEALHEVAPLAQDEGVSLLRDRIEAIRLDRSRPLEEAVLKDIHALLEGVPLALELAAGRARVLPLRELRCRLTCSFAVLDGQTSNRPQRQQTLHQAIEWSWRLLSAEEASALLQFGAFQSGCSLQVAEDVIRAQPSALDAITSLLDKSLLRSWQTEGQLRIGPYAYVREYILDKGGQALEHARQRHAEWALGLVAQTAASLDVDPEAGTVLIRELDNVLAAADWLVAAGRPEAADLLWNLRHLYYAKRLPTDLPRRLRAARSTLSLSKEQVDRLGLVMARVFGLRREHQRLAAEVERGLARVAPSSALRSDLVLMQARMAFASGNYRGAVELAEQSIKLAEQFGTEETLVRHFNTLGIAHRHLEQHEAAVAACRKAVVEAERVGAERLTATPLSNMAVSFRIQGDARRGLDCLRRAREVAERFKDARMAHWVQAQMAPLHAHLGELELADTLFQRVIADDQRFEQSNLGVGTRVNAGITALLCSDFERAAGVLEDTRQELTDQGRRGATLAICLSSLMVCRAALDDLERAEQVAEVLATIPPLELAPRIRLQLAISHGHLDVLRAVRARERGDAEGANQYRAEAERRCALERDTPEGTGLELVRDLLQRALDRYDART